MQKESSSELMPSKAAQLNSDEIDKLKVQVGNLVNDVSAMRGVLLKLLASQRHIDKRVTEGTELLDELSEQTIAINKVCKKVLSELSKVV